MGMVSFLSHINPDDLPIPEGARPADKPVLAQDHPDHALVEDFYADPRGRHFLNFISAHSDFLSFVTRNGPPSGSIDMKKLLFPALKFSYFDNKNPFEFGLTHIIIVAGFDCVIAK